MPKPDMILRSLVNPVDLQEKEPVAVGEGLVQYEQLLTPNQRRAHERLRATLAELFLNAPTDQVVTETIGDETVDTIYLCPNQSAIKKSFEYTPKSSEPVVSINDMVHRWTDKAGTSLYQVVLSTHVTYTPRQVAVMPRISGNYRRGTQYEPSDFVLTQLDRATYLVAPNLTLGLRDRPVLVAPLVMREVAASITESAIVAPPQAPAQIG